VRLPVLFQPTPAMVGVWAFVPVVTGSFPPALAVVMHVVGFRARPSGTRYIHFRDLLHLQSQTHTALGCTFTCFDLFFPNRDNGCVVLANPPPCERVRLN